MLAPSPFRLGGGLVEWRGGVCVVPRVGSGSLLFALFLSPLCRLLFLFCLCVAVFVVGGEVRWWVVVWWRDGVVCVVVEERGACSVFLFSCLPAFLPSCLPVLHHRYCVCRHSIVGLGGVLSAGVCCCGIAVAVGVMVVMRSVVFLLLFFLPSPCSLSQHCWFRVVSLWQGCVIVEWR